VFQTVAILQLTFGTAIVIYIVAGEVVRLTVDGFAPDGFVNWGSEIWILRGLLGALSLYSLVASHFIFTDERQLRRGIPKGNTVDDATVAMQLQTAQIVKLALTESIAIYGLVLYMMNADRLDLYLFGAVAVSNLILTRPRRDHWESAYRAATLRHSGVSSLPW
jgi:hypothetical protein